MRSELRAGRILGLLLLLHMATGLIVPYVWLQPLTKLPASFLLTASGMPGQIRFCVLLLFVGGLLPLAISIAAWPVVRTRSPQLGLWLLAVAALNCTLQIIENAHWLSMLSLSQAYVEAGALDVGRIQSLGLVVRAAWKWAHYSHILVVVAWLGLGFGLLLRTGMVPRTLAILGLVTCGLHILGITLPVFAGFRMPYPELFGMPLGVADLAVALWMVTKGFKDGLEGSGT